MKRRHSNTMKNLQKLVIMMEYLMLDIATKMESESKRTKRRHSDILKRKYSNITKNLQKQVILKEYLMLDVSTKKDSESKRTKRRHSNIFKKSTEMGNTDGIVNFGNCYREGTGVKQDVKKAFEYLKNVQKW